MEMPSATVQRGVSTIGRCKARMSVSAAADLPIRPVKIPIIRPCQRASETFLGDRAHLAASRDGTAWRNTRFAAMSELSVVGVRDWRPAGAGFVAPLPDRAAEDAGRGYERMGPLLGLPERRRVAGPG